MADVCWIAAQLLADCVKVNNVNGDFSPERPVEVDVRADSPAHQPERNVSPPTALLADPWLSQPVVLGTPFRTQQLRMPPPAQPIFPQMSARERSNLPNQSQDSTNQAQAFGLQGIEELPATLPLFSSAEQTARASTRPPQGRTIEPLQSASVRPRSGSQLYRQRLAALSSGQLYTRIAPNSFLEQWQSASAQPTYQQWQTLLVQEARAIASGQGRNRLAVVVGDSLSLWLPPESLPRDRFWLNQGISGDTTAGILRRLHYFADTRPTTIHLMAGINDIKNGASDAQIVGNLRQIMQRLRQQHPQAQLVVHSILPTRWGSLPSDRITRLNNQIAHVARQQGVEFLNLQPTFSDTQGNLRADFTTDGLHLSRRGYRMWQLALQAI